MTQADRVYNVLKDHQWHDTREIESITRVTRVTSRVWDLKQRGHVIESRPGQYKFAEYLLVKPGQSKVFKDLQILKQIKAKGVTIPTGLQQKLL